MLLSRPKARCEKHDTEGDGSTPSCDDGGKKEEKNKKFYWRRHERSAWMNWNGGVT